MRTAIQQLGIILLYSLLTSCGPGHRQGVPTPECIDVHGGQCKRYGLNSHCIDGNTGAVIVEGCCPSECAPFASTPDDFWCYEGTGPAVMEGQPPPCPPRPDAGSAH
jgi:hypothetical protein